MFTVALCHGLGGYDELRVGPFRHNYWCGIDRAIAAAGHQVLITRTKPVACVEKRARHLKESLTRLLKDAESPSRKLILVGHSMGGLDARYLVSKLGFAEKVSAVVTVCTPHRGSPFADVGVRNVEVWLRMLQRISNVGINLSAFKDLTTEGARQFNDDVPNAPGVAYFSIGCSRPRRLVPPWVRLAHRIIYDAEGDNDGLVSLKSASWGTSLGQWRAHHWHAINRRFPDFGPHMTGDIAPFYLRALTQVGESLQAA